MSKSKFTVCFLLAAAMALSALVGCGNGKENVSATSSASSGSDASKSEDGRAMEGNLYLEGTPIVQEKTSFRVMLTDSLVTKDPNEMILYTQRAEKTNVDIQYDFVLSTAVNERKATLFASGELPDAICNILSSDDIVKYASYLVPIEQYFGKYTPRLDQLMEANGMIAKLSTMPDGNIYGFPDINYYSVWPGNGLYFRETWVLNRKWMNKLGLADPTTTDELKKVLTAFKEQDPNGNGKADEIPYSFCYANTWASGAQSALYGPFGLIGPAYNVNVTPDGKCFFVVTDPRYKDCVKYVRDLYQNGLIDPEAFTQTVEQYNSKGQQETELYGLCGGWTGESEIGPDNVIRANNPNGAYGALAPVAGPDGSRIWACYDVGVSANRMVITTNCKEPQVLARYIDELYEADNSIQESYGVFGQCVKPQPDGSYLRVATPEGWNVEEWLRDTTTRVLPSAVTDDLAMKLKVEAADGTISGKEGELKYQCAEVYVPYAAKVLYPSVFRAADEVEEIGRLYPQIENLIKQKEVQWMTGVSDIDAEYDTFMETLKANQIDRVTELYQAALDRYNGK